MYAELSNTATVFTLGYSEMITCNAGADPEKIEGFTGSGEHIIS